jgi:hypothetical protein
MKKLVVVYVGNTPKAIMGFGTYVRTSMTKIWWDGFEMIEVPLEDWVSEKVNMETVEYYVKNYSVS